LEPFQIYLSPPHPSGNELRLLAEVVDQNWIAPAGPHLTHFEKKIENYLGNHFFATALQSGTAAIHLGIQLLGVGKGDIVLCQSLTFVATANPVIYLGATPIFIDSESKTWNICPELLEQAIQEQITKGQKPKAIIAVHLYGMPYQVDALYSISQKYEIPILEDSAEALGSRYKNEACGSFGAMSVFSFNGNKIITTGGGGVLICKSKVLQQQALKLATQAKEPSPHFEHVELGYNYRMSNLNAAVGCAQWEALTEYVLKRRATFQYYKEHLTTINGLSFLEEPDGFYANRWLSVVLTDSFEQREDIRKKLEIHGIESRPVWKPMHLQPLYSSEKSYLSGVSESIFQRGLCLPSGSQLTIQQLEMITTLIQQG
jgi:dTDP-4-amino-4,6-dideoxygalactose transaminase